MKLLPCALLLLVLLPCVLPAAVKSRSLQQHEVVVDKELLVTALDVVNAPETAYPGPWSFGHLMDETFGKELSRKAVAAWLDAWAKGANGPPGVPGREHLEERLTIPWQQRDGHRPGTEWQPDFANAPFRLLAIVNRMDLGRPAPPLSLDGPLGSGLGTAGYYSGNSRVPSEAGEARLIFGAVGPDGEPLAGGLTIIFEYGLDAPTRDRVFDWAMAWHRLGAHRAFDAAYRAELVQVSRLFTDRRPKLEVKANAPRKPDLMERLAAESPSESRQLLRVRINDGACGKLREFREFSPGTDTLVAAPLAGTPNEAFFDKGSAANRWLARWLEEQRVAPASAKDDPKAPKTEIPPSFTLPGTFSVEGKSQPVAATVATVPGNDPRFHWDGWGLRDGEMRRAFSLQTCCGCHCGDTSTRFFHVEPRSQGSEAILSKFLRTDGSRLRLRDPADRDGFLSSEIDDRKRLFEEVLNPNLSHRELRRIRGAREGRVH